METIRIQNRIPAAKVVLAAGLFVALAEVAQGQPPLRQTPMVEMFLEIKGIEGEVANNGQQGWIEVDSFTYTISRPVGTEVEAERQGLTLVKGVGKASPFLYMHCSSGRPLDEVVLEITRTAGDDVSVQEFRMGNVTVTSVQTSVSAGARRSTERVTLHYESIAWTYVKVDPVTGSVIFEVTAQWDLTDDDAE